VPAPITQPAADAEERRALWLSLASKGESPTASTTGTLVSGVIGPITPLVMSDTERRFTLRGLPHAVGAARRVLRDWESNFEPEVFYDLSLCVSELVTSIVERGEPAGTDQIELAVWRSNKLIRAEIRESRSDVVVKKPATMVPRDWGMFIVDRVADRWGVDRSNGTLVWCEIDLASDGRSRDSVS
jgi:hypothetical protein